MKNNNHFSIKIFLISFVFIVSICDGVFAQKVSDVVNLLGKSKKDVSNFLRENDYAPSSEKDSNIEGWTKDSFFTEREIHVEVDKTLNKVSVMVYCFNDKNIYEEYYRYKESKINQCPKEIKGDGRFVVNDNICAALSTKDSNELKRYDIDAKKYKYVILVLTIGKFSNYLEGVKKIKSNKN